MKLKLLDTVRKCKHVVWLGHVLRHESLLHDIIEGKMMGKAIRVRKRMHLLSDLMKGKYVKRTYKFSKERLKTGKSGRNC